MQIGYIPSGQVIGVFKIARIVEMFSRRLTKEVAHVRSDVLHPHGVAVVAEASRLCMVMRRLQKIGATTTISCMLGRFHATAGTRGVFLNFINRN